MTKVIYLRSYRPNNLFDLFFFLKKKNCSVGYFYIKYKPSTTLETMRRLRNGLVVYVLVHSSKEKRWWNWQSPPDAKVSTLVRFEVHS